MRVRGPAEDRQLSDELAIEASGLVKSYRDVRVLSGVDLRVPRGSVFALLGPNGAGKPVTELRHSCWCARRAVAHLAGGHLL